MCGITGYFTKKNDFNSQEFKNANDLIAHRGPNDFGYLKLLNNKIVKTTNNIYNTEDENKTIGAFGFRRLSIIDLSDFGHQPMNIYNGKYWIVFNGEIYNYLELREELVKKDCKFNTNTDTEVILHAYEQWGDDCLKRFNGMWSFCIYDSVKNILFCSRDRLGIKPFYYFKTKEVFIFASEIKQILEFKSKVKCEIKDDKAFDFLLLGSYCNENNETYFENIFKLGAGNFLKIDLSNENVFTYEENNWWGLPQYDFRLNLNENEVVEHLDHLLTDSIKLRLRSDVPVGTALSGGIDSSLIVGVLNKIYNGDSTKNLTFTIKSNEVENDDAKYSELISDYFKINNNYRYFNDIANFYDLEKLLWHQDEPIQTASIFGSWYLYKFIKETGVIVNLDGQGVDELLGGYYKKPFNKFLIDCYNLYGYQFYIEQVKAISNEYSISKSKIILNTFYESLKNNLLDNSHLKYRLKLLPIKKYFNNNFYENQFSNSSIINNEFYRQTKSILKNESYNLTRHTNLPGILRQVDRNSMAFSVEARLPYLDYRIVELLYKLPPHFLIRNGYTKHILRKVASRYLPEEVSQRKSKIGFRMPEQDFLKNNIEFVREMLNSIDESKFLNLNNLRKDYENAIKNKSCYNNVFWRIIIFSLWQKKFKITK